MVYFCIRELCDYEVSGSKYTVRKPDVKRIRLGSFGYELAIVVYNPIPFSLDWTSNFLATAILE